MSKSLLAAKLIGGGVLGTGAVAAGGIYIDKYIKSTQTTNEASSEINTALGGGNSNSQAQSQNLDSISTEEQGRNSDSTDSAVDNSLPKPGASEPVNGESAGADGSKRESTSTVVSPPGSEGSSAKPNETGSGESVTQ